MRNFANLLQSCSWRSMGVRTAILAVVAFLCVSLTAEAHGRKALPSDPVLFEQYEAGLAAYLDRDYPSALKAWRPLALRERESSAARLFLGFMYANGLGLAQDLTAAAEWYKRSASQDNMLAQVRLGFMYRRGEGVAQDPIQAYFWAALAARQDSHVQTIAAALQESMAAEMTPDQIAEAERLAREWIENHRRVE